MLIDSHTLLFFGGSVLRIDELEINTELKLISYDRREEGKCQGDETVFSLFTCSANKKRKEKLL